jgi:adenine-specific DNA-methyltransferase
MSQTNYNKLLAKLPEIFQLDQADLNFGIYRIMNLKRDKIAGLPTSTSGDDAPA